LLLASVSGLLGLETPERLRPDGTGETTKRELYVGIPGNSGHLNSSYPVKAPTP
jgi:hypothetical protein